MVKVSLMPALRRSAASITADSRRYLGAVPSRRATVLALACAAAALAAPAGAQEKGAPSIDKSPLLWATVNICDTEDHPDTVGIRGSMPGSGIVGEQMFMRFQVQYFDQVEKEWHNIGPSGDSGFVPVGAAKFKQRQSGRNFTVRAPRTGAFILRGAVTFEWRDGGEVVRRARKKTTSKHGPTAGADPAGFSVAKCSVTA